MLPEPTGKTVPVYIHWQFVRQPEEFVVVDMTFLISHTQKLKIGETFTPMTPPPLNYFGKTSTETSALARINLFTLTNSKFTNIGKIMYW